FIAEADPDQVTSLYGYNSRGELEVSAVDLNANGVIDYSTDRVTQVETVVGPATTPGAGGVTVIRETTSVWAQNGSPAASTLRMIEGTPNGNSVWLTEYGLAGGGEPKTTTFSRICDGSGYCTVTITKPDGTRIVDGSSLGLLTVRSFLDSN